MFQITGAQNDDEDDEYYDDYYQYKVEQEGSPRYNVVQLSGTENLDSLSRTIADGEFGIVNNFGPLPVDHTVSCAVIIYFYLFPFDQSWALEGKRVWTVTVEIGCQQ